MPATYQDRERLQRQAAAIAALRVAAGRYLSAFGVREDRALQIVSEDDTLELPTMTSVFQELDMAIDFELGQTQTSDEDPALVDAVAVLETYKCPQCGATILRLEDDTETATHLPGCPTAGGEQ